ncbi:cupin domain-containing protein [Chitinimonas naiadis]
MKRPECIRHYSEIQGADDRHYPGSTELLSIGSPFGRTFGFQRLGIHHELLLPGRRTSWPHAESTEEEFAYVIEGTPDVWLDSVLYRLQPGDAVGFKPGDGLAHTFINNTAEPVRLLVVGDTNRADNRIRYPLHPKRNAEVGDMLWADMPARILGPHNGLPDGEEER